LKVSATEDSQRKWIKPDMRILEGIPGGLAVRESAA
jgi:hypothetical protein